MLMRSLSDLFRHRATAPTYLLCQHAYRQSIQSFDMNYPSRSASNPKQRISIKVITRQFAIKPASSPEIVR
jgi:hypothetical protein